MQDFKRIDAKWQARYEAEKPFQAEDFSKKPKFYPLVEFPFPSGAGLHVGHPRSYTALDIVARKKRMEGFNVLYPMGWDAFGLPTENYALKTGIPPAEVTRQNTDNFRRQLKAIGFSFDWEREVNTTDPGYYKWTQWMFLEFFNADLAYKAKMAINWCPKDKIGLANEEAVGGVCDRCGGPVEKREKEQWMIAITKYADRLLEDLNTVNYLPKIKKQQEDWIGKSEGAEIDFALNFTFTPEANDHRGPNGEQAKLTVFTTRPDTLFGATYLVLAPEHLWVQLATDDDHHVLENKDEVRAYVESVKSRTDIDRTNDDKEKTGVELKGVKAINPISGEEIPLWVADYVLPQYGTGAIMAVPAHDERDAAFAQKFNLPVRTVVEPITGTPRENEEFRRSIVAIVRNPKTGEFLSINWGKDLGGHLFIGGGLEEGESPIDCARREITEETGYKNVCFVSQTETIHHHYFAHSKNKARYIEAIGLLFELENDETTETNLADDEKGKMKAEWIDEKAADGIAEALHEYVFDRLVREKIYVGDGVLAASGEWSGKSSVEARDGITSQLEEKGTGRKRTIYKLRDWVFSRQRYWGEPIPLVHCKSGCGAEHGGWVALPESDLPLTLPEIGAYEPTDTGESPLASIADWVNTKCPQCGGEATRETDTMPNWAGSSWYFLRYIDPHNDQEFASKDKLKYWLPIDLYNGGMEHTTLHLLYSRFWHKFLVDRGHIPVECGNEPYARRHSHGLIMAEDGQKMSKSKGNVVNPDEVVAEFGADVFRTYMLFLGPFEEPVPWQKNGLIGVSRFLERVAKLADKLSSESSAEVKKSLHKTIAKVGGDIEGFRFNTAVAALMTCLNEIEKSDVSKDDFQLFLRTLAPMAPHLANELWEKTGGEGLIENASWPIADAAHLASDTVVYAVQVDGKTRGSIEVANDATEDAIVALAKADPSVAKYLTGDIKKTIVVKGRIVSFVL